MHLQRTPALQTAVEVELWEACLLRDRAGLQQTLCTYALDTGPAHVQASGMLVFRFTRFDWSRVIRRLLDRNNIHYTLLREVGIDVVQQLRKKIYLADGDAGTLFSLSALLEGAGYQVRISNSGKSVLEDSCVSADLFILDDQLGDINGPDLCRHIRSQSMTRHTPIILLCKKGKSTREAIIAGATNHVEKPFLPVHLLNVVVRHMRNNS